MIDLRAVIAEANQLEPLPASATRLAQLVSREDTTLQQIAEVVQFDPSLTGRVIRAANSAMLAGHSPVTTVPGAIARMGLGRVLSLAVGAAVKRIMRKNGSGDGSEEATLWEHSVASALAAEVTTKYSGVRVPPEAFTAALLHDIGKVVLLRHLGTEEREILARAWHEGGVRRFVAEREMFGCDHAELGGLVTQQWGLPDNVRVAISHHHAPDQRPDLITDVVAVSNAVAHQIGSALGDDTPEPGEPAGSRARLGLDEASFERLCTTTREQLDNVLQRY